MRVDWDPIKSAANSRKHGVSFEQAAELLASDADYLETYDEHHSEDEDRFIALGRVARRVIVVVFTEHENDVVRIISARVATKFERGTYEAFEKAGRAR